MADFALLKSQKLISRKIWVVEKLWHFHTVELSEVYPQKSDIALVAIERCLNKNKSRNENEDTKLNS